MAWQILLYHDVNWEEPRAVRGLGGTCPPDVFRAHVAAARELGDIVSPAEAARRITADPADRVVSFWFDDGLAGVARYAAPILADHGVAGTVALCSQFWRREAPFWRFQLATLATLGRAAEVRAALAAAGIPGAATAPLRDLVMDAFGPPVLAALDQLWATLPASERDAALHAFLHHDDIAALVEAGWTLANHTAAHHPVGEARALDHPVAGEDEVAPVQAGGEAEGEQGAQAQDHGHHRARAQHAQGGQRPAQQRQDPVAPEAAQPARQRPGGGRDRSGQGAGQQQHPQGADGGAQAQRAPGPAGVAGAGAAEPGGDHQQGGDPGGQAQRLQAGVGPGRAEPAQEVGGYGVRGRVPARVGRIVGGEGGDQGRAEGGDQAAPETRRGV